MSALVGTAGATARRIVAGVVCLVVAGVSYLGATGLLGSLYAYRSPVAASPATGAALPLAGPIAAPSRRVVAVLVDGLRVDTAADATAMPFLAELRTKGASATMGLRTPSYSVPGWTVLMTGAWPEVNGGLAMNPPVVSDAPAWTTDSIFRAARDVGLWTGVSGTDWFAPLIPGADLSTSFFVHEENDAADQASTDAAMRMIAGEQADFVLVHLNEIDHAGHYGGGGASPATRTAAGKADARLRAIAGALDLTQDTLVVFSDHGHLDQGGHGGPEDIVVRSPLVLAGAGVRPGATLGGGPAGARDPMAIDAAQVDLAPTLAVLLGTQVPASAQGQALTSLLSLPPDALEPLRRAQAEQQRDLVTRYAAAVGSTSARSADSGALTGALTRSDPTKAGQEVIAGLRGERLQAERWQRLWPGAGLLVLLLAGLAVWWRSNPRRVPWALAGAAAYLLVFHGYYWGLARRTYSMSSVTSATDVLLATATATLLGVLAAWVVALAGERPARRGLAGTLGGVGYAVGLALVGPIIVGVIQNGWTVGWSLPEALPMFLQFFGLVQALVVAVLTLLGGLVAIALGRGRPA